MYESVRELYLSKGFGGRVGFGARPAVAVIDMARSWLDESSPLGSRHVAEVMDNILAILSEARRFDIPIFFTTMAFDAAGTEADGPIGRKLRHSSDGRALDRNSVLTALDPRLGRNTNEILLEKQRASAFWGTPFLSYLVARSVDTLIIAGCSTSGCIRSTAESAHNESFHTIVVGDAVGDRSQVAHECNLIDIDLRFADVVPTAAVLEYLRKVP
jgi:maleamate amidohydrolase